MLEHLKPEIDQRVQSLVQEAFAEAMRSGALELW
jgi:hypothetical protein